MVIRQTSRSQSLPLALLMNLCAMSVASAQPTDGAGDLSTLVGAGRTFIVVDAAGQETRGKALRFTPEQLTMMVGAAEVSFDRQNVTAVYERTNSVKKGVIVGLLTGPALGLASVIGGEPVDAYTAFGTLLFSGIGVAVGAAVDAMIPETRLVYQRKGGPDDFRALPRGRVVSVVSTSGVETSGRLLRFTTEEVTLENGGRDRTYSRQQIAAIFDRGDSIKNGMILGLVTGFGAGFIKGAMKDDCDHTPTEGPAYFTPLDCYADEKVAFGLQAGALGGLAGAGIGVVIDRLIVRRRQVYGAPTDRAPVAISLVPSLSRSRAGLLTSVSW